MYSLIRALPLRRLVPEQGSALALSLVIAEMYYKFHSFLLETGAFLLTWYAIDFVIQTSLRVLQRPARDKGCSFAL